MIDAMAGMGMSGVMVATTTRSISATETPASVKARSAAFTPMSEAASPGAAMRRSRIPLRVTIHSSEVSTRWAISALVRMRSGA
jgi:hypothetical protein